MRDAIALGIVFGLGVLGILTAARPVHETLYGSLQILDSDPTFADNQTADASLSTMERGGRHLLGGGARSRVRLRLATVATSVMNRMPSARERLRIDLACTDSDIGELGEHCFFAALVGILLPFVSWAVLVLRGVGTPLSLPVWVGLVGATSGGSIPIIALRTRATKSKRHARRSVGCFLDLVVLALAGGLGIEGALHAAAAISDSPVSRRIARTLDVARDSGDTPWNALSRLGRELGVVELVELASAVSLAGTEGARVKSTLAAKAGSIRRHELADAETEANTITDRLFLPGVLLLIGFLIFIGYPAVSRLSSGL